MAIGRTNAVKSKMKTITGNISFSSQRDGYTDYTIDYAIIPASLIGFTPKIVLLGRTKSSTSLTLYYPDEKVIYGAVIFEYVVFPDGTTQLFTNAYNLKPTGASADVSYITLGGIQYAYKDSTGKDTIWLHNDGSLRLVSYRKTSVDKAGDVTYIIHG